MLAIQHDWQCVVISGAPRKTSRYNRLYTKLMPIFCIHRYTLIHLSTLWFNDDSLDEFIPNIAQISSPLLQDGFVLCVCIINNSIGWKTYESYALVVLVVGGSMEWRKSDRRSKENLFLVMDTANWASNTQPMMCWLTALKLATQTELSAGPARLEGELRDRSRPPPAN